jgi:hypothetical protein
VCIEGPNPTRILLIGAGLAMGYGVHSHKLGLGGELARQLSALTGRGSAVDIVAVPNLNIRGAQRLLSNVDLGEFDVLVTALGMHEAMTLTSRALWARSLDGLFDTIEEGSAPALRTFVLGIAPITSLVVLPRPVRPLVEARIDDLNEHTREACAERDFTLVPFEPEPIDVVKQISRGTYVHWARLIAPAMASSLALADASGNAI